MKILMELKVHPDTSTIAMDQFFQWAKHLENPHAVSAVSPEMKTVLDQEQQAEQGDAPDEQERAAAPGTAPVAPRGRGRPRRNVPAETTGVLPPGITAVGPNVVTGGNPNVVAASTQPPVQTMPAQAAVPAVQETPAPFAASAQVVSALSNVPGMSTLLSQPPVTAPGVVPLAPSVTAPPQAAAMPPAAPIPAGPAGEVPLEALNNAAMECNSVAFGIAFNVMKAHGWYRLDMVPVDQRAALIDEMYAAARNEQSRRQGQAG